ncbi:MAG: T9SS type A sorting domain-containing protein [Bacteroidota bacterium]
MKKHILLFILSVASAVVFAQTTIQMQIPAQASTFSGNVRGYWFAAPTCFTITGIEVPTDASSGVQNIAIVRLYAPPPLYSTTTNNFTTLFLDQNSAASGMIPINIQVEQGDIIGILGSRADINSYASGPVSTTIEGMPVTLERMGMQYPLSTTTPMDLWTEASGSISRVWMYYDSLLTYNINTVITNNVVDFTNGADSSFISVWNYGDGSPLDTTWSPTHTYATPGTYTVCSYITTTCEIDTVCTSVTITSVGMSTAFGNTSVKMFPNPVRSNAVFIVKSDKATGTFSLNLTDIHGNVVSTYTGNVNEELTIDCSVFASGMYFYKAWKDGNVLGYGKMIMEK